MLTSKLGFTQHLVAKLPSTFHDCSEHLVIAAPGEEDLACIELEKGAAYRPYVDAKVVRHAKN